MTECVAGLILMYSIYSIYYGWKVSVELPL